MTIAALIQSGESTHHHDQLLTGFPWNLTSFRTINATASNPTNPMPLLLLDELLLATVISPSPY